MERNAGERGTSLVENESPKRSKHKAHNMEMIEKKEATNGQQAILIGIYGRFNSETGTICFWPIARLVGCVIDIILKCIRFQDKMARVYP